MNLKVARSGDGPIDGEGPVSGVTLKRCPECGSSRLGVMAFWYRADFVCEECNACWRIQHGWLFKIDADAGAGAAGGAAPLKLAAIGEHVTPSGGLSTRARLDSRRRAKAHRKASISAWAVPSTGSNRTK